MKHILLLATGGTIASRPTAAGGLAPAITSEELLACVPELADLCAIDAVQLFNLDSTNVGPAQWQKIVRSIRENYAAYDGFVIAHGTDTMAYTAAALSYMIQNSAKPVVLTGSQKSIYNRDTDARNNLYRAFVYAVSRVHGACSWCLTTRSFCTRARKTRTRSFDAFSSIDYPETAVFRDTSLSPSCGGRPICRPFSFMSSSTPPSLCCGWCRVCGQILSRCWPSTTVRLCWKASAWAACRAVSRAKCLPNCAAGATADGWPCLRPKSRMRGATLRL